jgi:Fe-S-cluster containining protein
MATPQEIAELKALDKDVEKESVRRLRANRSIDFALQFAGYAQAEVDRVRDAVVRKGVHFDCKKGCSWCCHFQIEAQPQEIFLIARELRRRGELASILAALRAYAEHAQQAQSFRRDVACPFLVDNACSIYNVRPIMCRKCNSLNVEKCKDPHAAVPENPELALKVGAILHGTINAYERNKLPSRAHELAPGVLLALTDADAETRWYRGEDVFATD